MEWVSHHSTPYPPPPKPCQPLPLLSPPFDPLQEVDKSQAEKRENGCTPNSFRDNQSKRSMYKMYFWKILVIILATEHDIYPLNGRKANKATLPKHWACCFSYFKMAFGQKESNFCSICQCHYLSQCRQEQLKNILNYDSALLVLHILLKFSANVTTPMPWIMSLWPPLMVRRGIVWGLNIASRIKILLILQLKVLQSREMTKQPHSVNPTLSHSGVW